ncbi:MAG TPA: hypothetical protein EYQ27_08760 [Gemmatimonadetes bacterium]|nr:hypothetical protein [Gemmatimonadota bacterium]
MLTLPVLDELPAGYFVEESPGGVAVLHADVLEPLHDAGFGPDSDGSLAPSALSGRKPLFQIEAGGETYLLRRFSHGGLLRWLTGARFLDAERPFRELILSDALRRVGINTPQVVAARARTNMGIGWRLEIMTRWIKDTIDLGYVLGMAHRGELAPTIASCIAFEFGDLVRRMHLHGCVHADLKPQNILVSRSALEGGEVRLWVIDLDRSFFTQALGNAERRSNLRQLYRHISRRGKEHRAHLPRTDFARFLRGYDPERTRWKEDWREISAMRPFGSSLHRFGWLLERLFSSNVDPRVSGDVIYPHAPPPAPPAS